MPLPVSLRNVGRPNSLKRNPGAISSCYGWRSLLEYSEPGHLGADWQRKPVHFPDSVGMPLTELALRALLVMATSHHCDPRCL
jgi:hypothetical protein